jgi:hypothetical protein
MLNPPFNSKKNRCTKRCTKTAQRSPATTVSPAQRGVIRFKISSPRVEVLPHNPEVVGSNPTPATMGAKRENLQAPVLLSVTSQPEKISFPS